MTEELKEPLLAGAGPGLGSDPAGGSRKRGPTQLVTPATPESLRARVQAMRDALAERELESSGGARSFQIAALNGNGDDPSINSWWSFGFLGNDVATQRWV